MKWVIAALSWALVLHTAVTAASRLTPPVLPLIVRNPYLSTWLADARHDPWSKWPMFWAGENVGMSLMAHVPSTGNVYPLLGRPHDSLGENKPENGYNVSYPTFRSVTFDASTTNLSYSIAPPSGATAAAEGLKPLELTLSFLSPITPTSTLRQSIPASYVTVHAKGNMNVNVYMDMNGQWVSGNRDSKISWKFDEMNSQKEGVNLYRWQVSKEQEQLFTENHDRSEWGSLYFLAPSNKNVRYESGVSAHLRQRFAKTGLLQNVNDKDFRPIMDNEPVFSYTKSFILNGTADNPNIDIVSDEVTFTIALIQDPVVQFASARGLTLMRPLWASWYPTVDSLLGFHYFDFQKAKKLAQRYSDQLAVDAYQSGAEDYVDIVALSARQVLGATQFSGTAENPILFLKEISSNGNSQTVDVIFPSFPFFLYTNPRWLAYLLEPLIEHMLSGQYPNNYSMHDLGSHYPNMTGHADGKDEYMPVEECGNMLIMGLAVVNSLRFPPEDNGSAPWHPGSGRKRAPQPEPGVFPLLDLQTINGVDKLDSTWGVGPNASKQARKWVERSYRLWKQWTGYLVDFSLEPHNQLSTDDFAGWLALQTNLALKGIVGINAMSELARFINKGEDYRYYKNISDTYVAKWEDLGFSRDKTHAKVSYDWHGSWTTLYNLYADALLCFHLDGTEHDTRIGSSISPGNQIPLKPKCIKPTCEEIPTGFVPRHVYSRQSQWYYYVRQKYGLPLDSRHRYAKTDWEFFAMAVSSSPVRHEILQSVALWVNETVTDRPLTDLHETEGDGGFPGPNFFARPVVGGHFAFLALEKACKGKATEGLDFLDDKFSPDYPPGYGDDEGDWDEEDEEEDYDDYEDEDDYDEGEEYDDEYDDEYDEDEGEYDDEYEGDEDWYEDGEDYGDGDDYEDGGDYEDGEDYEGGDEYDYDDGYDDGEDYDDYYGYEAPLGGGRDGTQVKMVIDRPDGGA